MDKEKVLDYVMNSPGNSNRAVLSGMLDESGGGSSDFSTATVIVDGDGMTDIYVALTSYSEDEEAESNHLAAGLGYGQEITVILYKGKAHAAIMPDSGLAVNVSGNIIHVSGVDYIITGDCTITLSVI